MIGPKLVFGSLAALLVSTIVYWGVFTTLDKILAALFFIGAGIWRYEVKKQSDA